MMKTTTTLLLACLTCLLVGKTFAQGVSISSDASSADNSAMLDVKSTDKGMLVPRMTTAQRTAIASPATGLLVYDTDLNSFYFYSGTVWTVIPTGSNALKYVGTSYLGQNSGVGSTGTSEGTSSNRGLVAIGNGALNANTTGENNIGLGYQALYNNTTGSWNTAIGKETLKNNTTGDLNTAIGNFALQNNISGFENVAIGQNVLDANTTGFNNLGIGNRSLNNNTTGENNVALGNSAAYKLSTGQNNVALGTNALYNTNTGSYNIALGKASLHNNLTGNNNIAVGYQAGNNNNGNGNIFIGHEAGYNELGFDKLYIANSNTSSPLLYGDFNTKTLTINDNLATKYFKMTNGATNGYVLQSNASGNATWVNANTLSVNSALNYVGTSYLGKTSGVGSTGTSEGTSSNRGLLAIGDNALNANTTGQNNIALGYQALNSNTVGSWNVALGKETLKANINGNLNTAIGSFALTKNTSGSDNVAIGQNVLDDNTSGGSNIAIGNAALSSNTTGTSNIAIGINTLGQATTSSSNTAIGYNAGFKVSTGGFNTFLGAEAGNLNENQNNTMIGYGAGSLNVSGQANVFLGYRAGRFELGNNKLYISNSSTSTPLLYGEFDNSLLRVHGTLNINNAYSLPTNTGTSGFILQTDGAGAASWVNSNTLLGITGLTSNYNTKWNGTSFANGLVYDNGTNVGIGTASPTEKLEVSGKTKTTNLQMTNGATNGYILQTDASGNGTWVNATTLSNGNWTTSGINQYNALSGDVGIGTASPTDKLHVVGNARIDGGRLNFKNIGNSVFIGDDAGRDDDLNDRRNIFIGYQAGLGNITSSNNVAIGYRSLSNNNSSYNVAIGTDAMLAATGIGNTAVGGLNLQNTSGMFNVAVGLQSGNALTTGNDNVLMGYRTGEKLTTGGDNVFLGKDAGRYNITGSNNVFLGSLAGANTTGSNKLYIDNSNTNSPLLYGEFDNNLLRVNGTLNVNDWSFMTGSDFYLEKSGTRYLTTLGANGYTGIGTNTPTTKLHVVGDATLEGIVTFNSGWNAQTGTDFVLEKSSTRYFTMLGASGNVGIGVSAPTAKLEVQGKTKTTNFQLTFGAAEGAFLYSDASGNALWNSPSNLSIVNTLSGSSVPRWNGTILANGSIYDNGTNVGIGTTAPTSKLHVAGDATFAGTLNLNSNWNMQTGSDFVLDKSGTNYLTIYGSNGYVGLGTAAPSEKLDVVGKTKTTTFQMTLGASNGAILHTDASGNGSWVSPSLLSIVTSVGNNYVPKWNGTILTNGLIYDSGTNVGIGTTSPTSKLHVVGDATLAGTLNLNSSWNMQTGSDFLLEKSGTRYMTIYGTGGYVGIGTNTPTQAKLVVNGSQNSTIGSSYGVLNGIGGTGTSSGGADYSIYASARIAGSEFHAFSDARIKKITGRTNNANDLATLAKIRITDYQHIDSISKGNKTIKKVIAQELKAVYPQAVSTMTDVVPDIYQQASIENGFVALPTNLKVGEKIRIIFATGEEVLEVTEVGATGFHVNSDKAGKVFVFGRQVSDFHVVDYEALSTLNISATQELLKRIEALETENKTLKTENKEMQDVKAKVTNLEKQMADIQMLLHQSAKK